MFAAIEVEEADRRDSRAALSAAFMEQQDMSNARVVTEFVYPPIPDRRFDWSAIDDNTYDGEGCPIGRGATEQEAINDLLDHICMARGADVDRNNGCRYCTAEAGISCRAVIVQSGLSES